jgi:hypothetical protein
VLERARTIQIVGESFGVIEQIASEILSPEYPNCLDVAIMLGPRAGHLSPPVSHANS